MNQSENIGDLALALSKAQSQMNGAAKTSSNPFFKSLYADLHQCIEAAKEPLTKNELAVVQTTDTDETGNIWVYTTLIHSSGQWMRGRIRMRPKKDDDQATGSSITYGRRYGFAAIVGLAQKDDDGNEACAKPIEQQKAERPTEKPMLTQDNKKAWERAINVYAEKQSFEAIEKHMRISDENKEAIKKAAMAEV